VEAVSDLARLLLTGSVLSLIALGTLGWRVTRLEATHPGRLVGQLRLAQWAAVVLAAMGAIPIGLALAAPGVRLAHLDAAIGVMFVGIAGLVLPRDPREGLLLLVGSFLLHALLDIAHRPGWLAQGLGPPWFMAGSATYDVCLAALCYWARGR
jgi:hypothetical protein